MTAQCRETNLLTGTGEGRWKKSKSVLLPSKVSVRSVLLYARAPCLYSKLILFTAIRWVKARTSTLAFNMYGGYILYFPMFLDPATGEKTKILSTGDSGWGQKKDVHRALLSLTCFHLALTVFYQKPSCEMWLRKHRVNLLQQVEVFIFFSDVSVSKYEQKIHLHQH